MKGSTDATAKSSCARTGEVLGSQMVRRLVASFLFLLFALHAIVPALPTYVCTGMSGAHFMQPCCPGEASSQDGTTSTWSRGRCCEQQPRAVIDAKQPSPDDSQQALRASLAMASVFVMLAKAHIPPPLLPIGMARGSPPCPISGPSQSQRHILRI